MMVTQRSSDSGRYYAVATGPVNRDAKYEETQFGPKCTFSITWEAWQDEQKKWHNKYLNCRCTKDLAIKASYLEKGDIVTVTGVIRETAFTDRKTGERRPWTELVCDNVILPSTPAQAGMVTTDEPTPFEETGGEDYALPF